MSHLSGWMQMNFRPNRHSATPAEDTVAIVETCDIKTIVHVCRVNQFENRMYVFWLSLTGKFAMVIYLSELKTELSVR